MSDYIQALRGLAVSSVLLFHLFPGNFPSGYLGVDMFFVISGFVLAPRITEIFQETTLIGAYRRCMFFYRKRFWRLFPALSVTLIISSCLILVTSPLSFVKYCVQLGIAATFGVANIGAYALSGDYFEPKVNAFLHTWSLSIEQQFYFFIPIYLILGTFLFRKRINLVKLYLILAAVSLVFFIFPRLYSGLALGGFIGNVEAFSFYSPFSRAWEFILGLLIFELRKFTNRIQGSKHSQFSHFALLPVALINLDNKSLLTIVTCLLTCFALLSMNSSNSDFRSWFVKILSVIGNYSYSIYLVHWPLIYIVIANEIKMNFFLGVFILAITFNLAVILKIKVEDRFRYGF